MFSCEYYWIFQNTYFEKTSANGCFCNVTKIIIIIIIIIIINNII